MSCVLKNKISRPLLCVIILWSLVSCGDKSKGVWLKTENDVWVRCHRDLHSNETLMWSGGKFDCVANGKGVLSYLKNGVIVEAINADIYYGALDRSLVRKLKGGAFFVGDENDRALGVQISGEDIYVGQFSHLIPDGQANWYVDGNLRYNGIWKQGKFEGYGTFYRSDGTKCSGVWADNRIVQADTTILTKHGIFKGYIQEGYAEGAGIMVFPDSSRYSGNWRKGKASGDGTFSSKEFTYEGHWQDGNIDGYGVMTFRNGDYYFGNWTKGIMSGEGEYTFNGIGTYKGHWSDGLQNGEGQVVTKDGVYTGIWTNGVLSGQVKVEYVNGDRYDGDFIEDRRSGCGVYKFKSGNTYKGQFAEDTFNGIGVFSFTDGGRYEGEFAYGRIAGEGTLCYTDVDESLQVAITAYWDGTTTMPEMASVLFSEGALYEGRILN